MVLVSTWRHEGGSVKFVVRSAREEAGLILFGFSDGYSTLTDEEKERAITSIYDSYYDLGICELYGYNRGKRRRAYRKEARIGR